MAADDDSYEPLVKLTEEVEVDSGEQGEKVR